MIDINEIQKLLPQRFPFLMIDRVVEVDPEKRVVAIKNVTMNEGFFAGHFPGNPVMPGALIIEAMAQSAIMLFYGKHEGQDEKQVFYLASVKSRFSHPVVPGDQLRIEVTPIKLIKGAAIVSALVTVLDKEVARGELSFSIKKGAL